MRLRKEEVHMKKMTRILLVGILSFVLGAFSGAIVWAVLQIMNLSMGFFWTYLPSAISAEGSLGYNLAVCGCGGVLIGLWQRKYGILPDSLETVMEKLKKDGSYPYHNVHILAVSALLPLIFGGTLGPEAGLTGLIAALCCFVGDRLKCRGDEVAALTESGIAAVMGVVFRAPLFGIIGNVEPDNRRETYRKKLVSKKTRIIIYCLGVLGALVTMGLLNRAVGSESGLPRFEADFSFHFAQWKWFVPLVFTGVAAGIFYIVCNRFSEKLAGVLSEKRVVSCVAAGVILAVVGCALPLSMFSGEHDMEYLMQNWMQLSAALLLLTALAKIFLVNICISLGWHGGSIFPIIFAGTSLGYAFAQLSGMDGTFAVAVTVAALYGYIMRKPVTVIAVLLLCFPLSYVVPVGVAALAASKIPAPGTEAAK